MTDQSIAGIAVASDDFSILVKALDAADLVAALDAEGADLTVFAPTDAAFTQLATDLGYAGDTGDEDAVFDFLVSVLTTLGEGDPTGPLTDILTYHVSAGTKTLATISGLETIETLQGATIAPDGFVLEDLEPDLINPALVATDIEATNGIVHVIDRVLLPLDLAGNDVPTISGLVDASGDGLDDNPDDFDILEAALGAAGLTEALDDPAADLTVFAPTDAAFVVLAQDLGFEGSDEAGALGFILESLAVLGDGDAIAPLTEILTYHVSEGAKQLANIAPLETVDTLQGGPIGIDGTTLVDQDPDIADPELIVTDIQTANGVVHAIDRVLLPLDLQTITDIVAASGDGPDDNGADFDLLNAALEAAGLTDALSAGNADLTVFAPTDAAFVSLAQKLGFTGTDEGEALTFILDALAGLNDGDPIAPLTQILTYHVSPGDKSFADIQALETVSTLEGTTIGVEGPVLVDQEPDLIDPTIIEQDVAASNGTIQVIDEVLLPFDLDGNDAPTIAGIVDASGEGTDDDNSDFDILEAALAATGLTDALDDPDADLTVFAPTDAAFIGLAQTLGFDGDDEAGALTFIVDTLADLGGGDPVPFLSDILLYHVAPDGQQLGELALFDFVPTLQGNVVGIDAPSIVDFEPDLDDPELVATDIQASNGIVHVIDGVLLPYDLPSDGEIVVGTQGEDRLKGTNDGDLLVGFGDDDRIKARDGDDYIDGGAGEDRVQAHDGNDILFGGTGNDELRAGRGIDILIGGAGDDELKGGRDADIFVFTSGGGNDLVRDFKQKHADVLDVRDLGIDSLEGFVSNAVQDGKNVVFRDPETNDLITLRKVDLDDLTASDFLFFDGTAA